MKECLENFLDCYKNRIESNIKECNTQSALPQAKGIYFICKDEETYYIGSASSDDRTIQKRVEQYFSKNDSGGKSLRNKIDKISTKEPIKWLNEAKFKYIELVDYSKKDILLIERICISIYNPSLND